MDKLLLGAALLIAVSTAGFPGTKLSFSLKDTTDTKPVTIAIDMDVVDQMKLISITPEPSRVRKAGTMYVYEFTTDEIKNGKIKFLYETGEINADTTGTISYNLDRLNHSWQN